MKCFRIFAKLMRVLKYRISGKINYLKFRIQWFQKNTHNYTKVRSVFPNIVEVGKETYGAIDVRYYGNPNEHLTIGNYCSIAADVLFLTGGNHPLDTFSQFPFDAYYNTGIKHSAPTKGSIVVGDDVWIGHGATILSGVTIGQGAVIGARSVVAKDVPPYAIYVGNKVVKYRFPPDVIEKLLKFDFSRYTRGNNTKYSFATRQIG